MSRFALNLVLALLWAAAQGDWSPAGLATGFAAGYLVLLAARPVLGPTRYHRVLWRGAVFAVLFLRDLAVASLRVARQVLSPGGLRPGIVAVPLDVESDVEVTLLAHLISMTPGTLLLDVSADRRVFWVHVIDMADPEEVRRAIKERLEARIVALRGDPTPPAGA